MMVIIQLGKIRENLFLILVEVISNSTSATKMILVSFNSLASVVEIEFP